LIRRWLVRASCPSARHFLCRGWPVRPPH
jgi:hypothetical protein